MGDATDQATPPDVNGDISSARRLLCAVAALALVAGLLAFVAHQGRVSTDDHLAVPALGAPTGSDYQLFASGGLGLAQMAMADAVAGNTNSFAFRGLGNDVIPFGSAFTSDSRDLVVIAGQGTPSGYEGEGPGLPPNPAIFVLHVPGNTTLSVTPPAAVLKRPQLPSAVVANPAKSSQVFVAFPEVGVFALDLSTTNPTWTTTTPLAEVDGNVDITALSVSPDGNTLYLGTFQDDTVALQAFTQSGPGTATVVRTQGPDASDGIITDLAVSPDGSKLFVADGLGAYGYDLPLGNRSIPSLVANSVFITDLTVSPDGKTVFAAGDGEDQTLIDNTAVCNGGCFYFEQIPVASPASAVVSRITSGYSPGGYNQASLVETPDGKNVLLAASTIPETGITVRAAPGGPSTTLFHFPLATPSGPADVSDLTGKTWAIGFGGATQGGGQYQTVGSMLAVTPDQAPVADFTATPGTAGSPTSFDASNSSVAYGNLQTYSWDFGDGAHGSGLEPTHVYAAAGTYSVRLVETDSAGTSLPPSVATFATDSPGQTPYRRADPSAGITELVAVPPAVTTTTSASTTSTTEPAATTPLTTPVATTTTTGPPNTATTTQEGTSTSIAQPPFSPSTAPALPPPSASLPPAITLNPTVGPPGTVVSVAGVGFPADSSVDLTWTTTSGMIEAGSVAATTDSSGTLHTTLRILEPDVLGPRSAVAEAFPTAKASFLVVPSTSEPGGEDANPLFRAEGE